MSNTVREEQHSHYDMKMLFIVTILVVVGLVFAFSASFPGASRPKDFDEQASAFSFFKSHAMHIGIGAFLLIVFSRIHPCWFQRSSTIAFWCSVILLLAAVYTESLAEVRGSPRFLRLGGFQIHPAEFIKLAFVAYLANKLSQGPLTKKNFLRIGLKILLAVGVFGFVLMKQKDQGMAFLITFVALGMLYLGGVKLRWVGGLIFLGFVAALGFAYQDQEVRWKRILGWLNPLEYIESTGRQTLTMQLAAARGHLAGVGLGELSDKWRTMSDPHTDEIVSIIGGEYGFIGTTLLMGLFFALILRFLHAAQWARDSFGYYLAGGFAVMLGMHTIINVYVATGLMPVTGLTLPFISYGGSSLIVFMIAVGMVLSVYRHNPPLRKAS